MKDLIQEKGRWDFGFRELRHWLGESCRVIMKES